MKDINTTHMEFKTTTKVPIEELQLDRLNPSADWPSCKQRNR